MVEDPKYIARPHHDFIVMVREDLVNTHRDVCMCYDCINFNPGMPEDNCPIANLLFAVCIQTGITSPVYECPEFVQGKRYQFKTPTGQP